MSTSPASTDKALRILIVEDDEDDFIIIRDFIQDIPGRRMDAIWTQKYQEALDAIQLSSYDFYFIDYHLTNKTGLDLLTEAMIDSCEAPIILLTGKGNPTVDKKAMQLGAADYLVKSELTSEKLERSIRYALERMNTLRKLRHSEWQYRNLFERTRDVIFIVDRQLRIQKINEAATSLLGYTAGELLHMSLFDFFAHTDNKNWFGNKLLQTGRVDNFQADLITKGHEIKVGIISSSLETDTSGRRYGQGIIHEITLLKRTEQINLQIEKLEAKGRVIQTLAHEVRNPLNNIQLSVANIKTATPGQIVEYLEIIERNGKRIDDLINDLIDSTRFYPMKLATTSLQSVMYEAISVSQDQLNLHHIDLHLKFDEQGAMVMIDAEKIRIAFLNLIINAIEAMDKVKPLITISIARHSDYHVVSVEDNGCGMTQQSMQSMFEPYFTTKVNGMGLGLANTHAIITSHKATIKVESIQSESTLFTLSFPALPLKAHQDHI
jgi:PAS domain S-box-containing protein